MEGRECRNWLEIPPEITCSILHRLGAFEILENAQKVCRSWRDLCREPSMWKIIDMSYEGGLDYDFEIVCRHAIDRSQGGLVDINIESLLQYLADSSSNLRRLRLAEDYQLFEGEITQRGVVEAVKKFPLLEDLEVRGVSLQGESLKVIGQSCPNLKTLKLNRGGYRRSCTDCDEDALAIAENMPELRHLQLLGNNLTDTGLNAILDKCLHLEHLDLHHCFNITFVGNLEEKCSEKIKVVRLPIES